MKHESPTAAASKLGRASSPESYRDLCAALREAATLGSIGSLLNWDQETYMPAAASAHRASQIGVISALAHEKYTASRIGDLLAACEADRTLTADSESPDARNLREIRREYDRATKLPTSLVAELAATASLAQEAWKDARTHADFSRFRPMLERMVELTRRKAECYGAPLGGELYDALLDEFEPGTSSAEIETVFRPLAAKLTDLVKDLRSRSPGPDESFLHVKFDPVRQHELGTLVLTAMGFDFNAGRLDTTAHPFCSGMAPGDTRLTTRYRGEKFTDALYGTMHEGGHGLYEQGLPKAEHFGQPIASAISLGIHESQSRMWENAVGRSREFWHWALPHAQRLAGGTLDRFIPDQAYAAVNTAKPSLIRVEADESTYNLHILLRFEIERSIFRGELPVKDVPGAWNARFKELLGLDVPDDRHGCLQDVHWSAGLIGYFPTYTLGNLYAAQFWETINAQIPDLSGRLARGEFRPLREWLRENIHRHGSRYRAGELCVMITGRPLEAAPLLRHLEHRLRPVYGG